jgi:hypothetical protein
MAFQSLITHFTAIPVAVLSLIGWPDITAQGGMEAEAVSALRRSFSARLRDAKVIPLELDRERPWLQTAAMFEDELDALIAEYRRERDVYRRDDISAHSRTSQSIQGARVLGHDLALQLRCQP